MARYIGPVCKQCRREGIKLFLKGDRCNTDKCGVERRSYAPGQHGQRRTKITDYGTQLREKQKVRRIYGVFEAQFRKYFKMAERMRGVTGENLLMLLERRLDNMVFRVGFLPSRKSARQAVLHGYFHVNGRRVTIPSFLVKAGDVISLKPQYKDVPVIKNTFEGQVKKGFPSWMDVVPEKFSSTIKALPTKDEVALPIKEQLIVELYSK